MPRVPRSLALAAVAAAAALGAAPAARAAEDPTARGLDPDPHRLALSLDGGFAVETAAAAEPGVYRAGALLERTDGLLALTLGGRRDDLLESRLALHLLGGYSLGWAEVSAHLPVALRQESDFSLLTDQGVTGALVEPIAGTALGDLRLGAKVPLLGGARAPFALAALGDLRLPTGDRDAFTGEGLAFVPSLVATGTLRALRLDAQVGYHLRGRGQYTQLVAHDGVVYGLGASLDLPRAGPVTTWRAIAELTGGFPRGWDADSARYRAPLSARAGLRVFLSPAVSVEAGGGAGLGEAGYGRERWRAFVGLRVGGRGVVEPDADPDGDGLPNAKDLCPTTAGAADLDGCPDRDDDGIPDREDRCPAEPGEPEREGCPADEDEPVVEIETERLNLRDAIRFDTGRDTIRRESFPTLDQIARVLLEHPEIERLRVEGHTDAVGAAAYNKDLSARRAASVVRYLVGRGVAASRLLAAGYGFERPIASNATALGRARNRRVDFRILPAGAP